MCLLANVTWMVEEIVLLATSNLIKNLRKWDIAQWINRLSKRMENKSQLANARNGHNLIGKVPPQNQAHYIV